MKKLCYNIIKLEQKIIRISNDSFVSSIKLRNVLTIEKYD